MKNIEIKIPFSEDINKSEIYQGDKFIGIISNEDLLDRVLGDKDMRAYNWVQGAELFLLTPEEYTTLKSLIKTPK